MVERADSSLDVGTDGSSEAEMLFAVLRGMWTKPSKKQTEKRKIAKPMTMVTNCSQRRKTPKKNTEEKGRQNPARREN